MNHNLLRALFPYLNQQEMIGQPHAQAVEPPGGPHALVPGAHRPMPDGHVIMMPGSFGHPEMARVFPPGYGTGIVPPGYSQQGFAGPIYRGGLAYPPDAFDQVYTKALDETSLQIQEDEIVSFTPPAGSEPWLAGAPPLAMSLIAPCPAALLEIRVSGIVTAEGDATSVIEFPGGAASLISFQGPNLGGETFLTKSGTAQAARFSLDSTNARVMPREMGQGQQFTASIVKTGPFDIHALKISLFGVALTPMITFAHVLAYTARLRRMGVTYS